MPASANWPDSTLISPILTVPCALAAPTASTAAARPLNPDISLCILSSQRCQLLRDRSGSKTQGQFVRRLASGTWPTFGRPCSNRLSRGQSPRRFPLGYLSNPAPIREHVPLPHGGDQTS